MGLKNYTLLIVVAAFGTISCSKVQFSPVDAEQGQASFSNPGVVDPVTPPPVVEPPPVVNPPPAEPPPVVNPPPVEPPPVVNPPPVEPPPVVNPPPVEPPPVVNPPPVVVPPTPVAQSETFTQAVAARKLDILFVMDNSDSMFVDYNNNVQNKFSGFISSLSGLDYQIGVTTSDIDHDQLRNFPGSWGLLDFIGTGFQKTAMRMITGSTSNAESNLLKTLHRDEVYDCRKNAPSNTLPCGSDNEQPLGAIVKAVSRASESGGFYRSDAELITIVLSDEDELSTGGPNVTQPATVVSKVKQYLGANKQYRAFGAVVNTQSCLSSQRSQELFGQASYYGTLVNSLAQQTGGATVDFCASEYKSTLNAVANGAWSEGASKTVTLAKTPVDGSVTVSLSPSNGITWTISGKVITFSSKPVAGTVINVNYTTMP